MCGICGFVGLNNDSLLREMNNAISHRGLDDEGYYSDADVGLGFRRLSIIDLMKGNQPILNEDKTVASICNGEIYNFQEIKDTLVAKGHKFSSNTDTEILPHAYEEWGVDFVRRLNGMFAFALWDKNKKKLYLVRDRLGIRPLHYTLDGTKLIFASEVKAILKYSNIDRQLDNSAMDDFLTFRYLPGETTFFRKIKILEPAHVLIYSDGDIKITQYWDFSMEEKQLSPGGNWLGSFNEKLNSSVKRCLLSDVPIGLYLSGGLDSSVIAALVKIHYGQDFTVFSHGFDGRQDELKYARCVAKYLGLRQEEVFIKEEHFSLLPEIIYHLDMPIANSDIIGFYLLAQRANQFVKVILTGEGSDELFGSYVHQETLYYGYKLKQLIPGLSKTFIAPLIKKIPLGVLNTFFRYPGNYLDEASRAKILEYLTSQSLSSDYFALNSLFRKQEKEMLYTKEFSSQLKEDSPGKKTLRSILEDEKIKNIFSRLIYAEFKYWLPTYHLMKEDKIAMAFCLESRYPYLDHTLVEFMAGLPVSLKRRGLKRKYLLRKVAKGLIPEKVVNRQKGPILVPIDKCFDKSFETKLRELFTRKNVEKRRYFNFEYISHLIENRKRNPFLYDRQLFAILSLELWHRIFVDGELNYG